MARLAIFRSMHNVRPGERHVPSRAIELDAAAVAYLRVCDVEVGHAWATDRLTDIRRRMEAERKLLESYARDAGKDRAALAADPRWVAVNAFVELAREAEDALKTLVYDEG